MADLPRCDKCGGVRTAWATEVLGFPVVMLVCAFCGRIELYDGANVARGLGRA